MVLPSTRAILERDRFELNDEAFYTLHRHWIWCEVIKSNFDEELLRNPSIFPESVGLQQFDIAGRYGAYKSVWYGLLFSILQVLKKNKIVIEAANNEISDLYKALYDYRNAVFHPQPAYWSEKLFNLMRDEDSGAKIRKVHDALRGYFDEEIAKRKPPFTYRYETIN